MRISVKPFIAAPSLVYSYHHKLVGIAVLICCVVLVYTSSSYAQFPDPNIDVSCMCVEDNIEVEILGFETFTGTASGHMTVRTGIQYDDSGLATMPMEILSHNTKGTIGGLGSITVDHDFSRPSPYSILQELSPGTYFPAKQEMYVNILITIDSLPDMTLRNISTATLQNPYQNSFPPSGVVYTLQEPMALEDVTDPGTTVAIVHSYRARIESSYIPTLTEWGMIIFCVLLFGWMAWVIVRRRRRVTAGI